MSNVIADIGKSLVGRVVIPAQYDGEYPSQLEVVAETVVHCVNRPCVIVNGKYVFSYDQVIEFLKVSDQ